MMMSLQLYLRVPVVLPLPAELRHGQLARALLAELVQREHDEGHDDGADGGGHPVEGRADRPDDPLNEREIDHEICSSV